MKYMKKTLLLMLMLVFTNCVTAQKPSDDFAHRLFEARLAEVCLRLGLSDETKEKFASIYEQYCNDLQALRPKPKQQMSPKTPPAERGKQEGPKMSRPKGSMSMPPMRKEGMTDAEKLKGIKGRMEAQHRAQEIRLAYLEKFSAILTDNQLVRFYEVEEDIQKKLHERANMGGHPNKGKK